MWTKSRASPSFKIILRIKIYYIDLLKIIGSSLEMTTNQFRVKLKNNKIFINLN